MSKYRRLTSHLESLKGTEWIARFKEIEAILGFALPKSAYEYQAWWSNQAGDGHSQSSSWQSAGWRTAELELAKQQVTFFRRDFETKRSRSIDIPELETTRGGLTIAEAKAGLAIFFGVSPENVEITIKG